MTHIGHRRRGTGRERLWLAAVAVVLGSGCWAAQASAHSLIDLERRETVVLGHHQGFTVPKGVLHRTRAPRRTAILMVQAAGVVPTGD
jgi:hypothetical protein